MSTRTVSKATRRECIGLLLAALWLAPSQAQRIASATAPPPVLSGVLEPASVALVVNDNDPESVEISTYYQARRRIPAESVIRVRLPVGVPALERAAFEAVYREVRQASPARVRAYVLAWTRPYRVDCMGIRSVRIRPGGKRLCDGLRHHDAKSVFRFAEQRAVG